MRNTCYTWLRKNHTQALLTEFDEAFHGPEMCNPETEQSRVVDIATVRQALEKLPVEFREVLVLREVEELSYKEIADVTGLAIGTVMSRLSRARMKLSNRLAVPVGEGSVA